MTFKDKSEEVLAEGRAQRSEYSPDPDSVPAKMYRYWHANTAFPPARENFCHYWRVVALWSPLMWVRKHTLDPVGYVLFKSGPARAFWGFLGKVFAAPIRGYKSLGTPRQRMHFWENATYVLLGIMCLLFLVMLVVFAFTNPSGFLMGLLLALVGVAGAGILILLGSWIGSIIDKRRKAAREVQEDAWFKDPLNNPDPWLPKRKKRFPRVRKFFRTVGDFLVLLVQIVRVNKWKICPIVDIPTSSKTGVDTTGPVV